MVPSVIPFHSLRNNARTLIERSELKVTYQGQQLLVRRRLAELPVCLRGIEDILTLVVHCAYNCVCKVLDADFFVFSHCAWE